MDMRREAGPCCHLRHQGAGQQPLSNGSIGVFEIGARVSAISLQDAIQQGDRQIDGRFGLNWYPDRDFRLMID